MDETFLFFIILLCSGGSPMVMHIWQENAATPLMLTHFGFGVGAIISPQIARPFLSDTVNGNTTEGISNVTTSANIYSAHLYKWYAMSYSQWEDIHTTNSDDSRIIICYSIVGLLILLISLFQLYFVLTDPPSGYQTWQPEESVKDMMKPSTCAAGDTAFGVQLLGGLCLFYALVSGSQAAYVDFLFSYATESDLNFSSDEASAINSAFFFCYTMGRLFGGLLARCVPVQAIIGVCTVLSVLEMVIIALFAEQNDAVFWSLTCINGFTITMLFPGGMGWSNLYLDMNSMAAMILLSGSSLGRIPLQYASGYVYETYEPNYITYVSAIGYMALLVVFSLLQFRASLKGSKYSREKGKEILDDVVLAISDGKDVGIENSVISEHDISTTYL